MTRRRTQTGASLIEVLIAIAVLTAVVVGVSSMSIVAMRSGSQDRQVARANALLSSFSESIKALPYLTCGTPDDYMEDFDKVDNDLSLPDAGGTPTVDPSVRLRDASDVSLAILDVEDNAPGGFVCPNGDSGTQRVSLDVTVGDVKLQGVVVKRSPKPLPVPPVVDFTAARVTANNAPFVSFRVQPNVNAAGEVRVQYWCNPSWAASTTDPSLPAQLDAWPRADDPSETRSALVVTVDEAAITEPGRIETSVTAPMFCGPTVAEGADEATASNPWQAPPGLPGTGVLRTIAIRVVDTAGITYPIVTKTVFVPSTTAGAGLPVAAVSVLNSPGCDQPGQCVAPKVIQVDGNRSSPADGTSFVRCRWNFGDGSEPEVVLGANCHDPANARSHEFIGKSPAAGFVIALTVYDNYGRWDTDSIFVFLDGVEKKRPTVSVQARIGANGTVQSETAPDADGVVPQLKIESLAPERVFFLAAATAFDGKTIATVTWDFFDGQPPRPQVGANWVDKRWDNPSSAALCAGGALGHLARVIVTDSDGLTNSKTVCILLRALGSQGSAIVQNPLLDIWVVDRKFRLIPWEFKFVFQWTPLYLGSSPLSDFAIEVQMMDGGGLCAMSADIKTLKFEGTPNRGNTKYSTPGILSGCKFRARLVRTFEGQRWESSWNERVHF